MSQENRTAEERLEILEAAIKGYQFQVQQLHMMMGQREENFALLLKGLCRAAVIQLLTYVDGEKDEFHTIIDDWAEDMREGVEQLFEHCKEQKEQRKKEMQLDSRVNTNIVGHG